MLDFSRINPFNLGKRDSFEELVCQLARREDFPEGSSFRRVEGAGGDGGVEAYWTKVNGKKTGYQAKYFLRCGEIDWDQINKSVEQALVTHPELELYIVALPCDLTDKSGNKRKGKTGWEHWNDHIKKWENHAGSLGVKGIKFLAWPTSELISKLADQNSEGLVNYFFGQVQLSSEWFKSRTQESVFALGDRFHPEDHVDVKIEKLFSVISRSPEFIDETGKAIQETIKLSGICSKIDLSKFSIPLPSVDMFKKILQVCVNISAEINLDLMHKWKLSEIISSLKELIQENDKLTTDYWDIYLKLPHSDKNRYDVKNIIDEFSSLHGALETLLLKFTSQYITAEEKRFAFIRGEAGSGKSHLLAKCAADAVNKFRPTVLILGQRINNSDIWSQMSQQLGLSSKSADELLNLLEAAGIASKSRVIILIDAINEGAGTKFWRNNLSHLIAKLESYFHICCVVSCRTEYFQLAVQNHLLENLPVFDIKGFETIEEQRNAARVYLDRRGISRPSTPWLAPEFINPLFLRSVCLSLEREGKSELPPGLTGTKKILEFYLKSIAKNIQENESLTASISSKLGKAAIAIAGKMLEAQVDFIDLNECRDLLAEQFKNINPQNASDWLSVFLNNGILRRDPNPKNGEVFSEEEIIRFSFQRFQDFLMAEKSLEGVQDPRELFENDGSLAFCVEKNNLSWEWRGLLDALGIALPEKVSAELIDVLPGGIDKWRNNWSIHEIFTESIKWRSPEAFSNRTLELLNLFWSNIQDPMEVFVQVSVSANHPWNADFLHKNLLKRKLSERDEFWTTWVNTKDVNEGVIGILIEWCLHGQVPHTNKQNQFLAALVLCWLFTSTNRPIRDKSTKSLSNILLKNKQVFVDLLERFFDVDDLYVLERLLAAAYGACCIDPTPERLTLYATPIFNKLFKIGKPPFGILLRDYALGILELAEHYSSLPVDVDMNICRPPYSSTKPRFNVTEQNLEEIAKIAGSDTIKISCTNMMGDFSSYEIAPRLRHFTNVSLSKHVPLTIEQRAKKFEKEIIGDNPLRIDAFEKLKTTCNPYSYGLLPRLNFGVKAEKVSAEKIAEWEKDISAAEKNLFDLLIPEEKKLYKKEVKPHLFNKKDRENSVQFEINLMKRWVAKRAYSFGWNKKKFGHDSYGSEDYSRSRPLIERIGKKYQWLALEELLSRLSDNYWLIGEYGKLPARYSSPLDLGFQRDIDPTIFAEKPQQELLSLNHNQWALEPQIILGKVAEDHLTTWPFEKNPADTLGKLPYRTDLDGVVWLVLYEHQSRTETYGEERSGEHNFRIQEFRFLHTIMVRKSDAKAISGHFAAKRSLDVNNFSPPEITDAAFLYEAPWRGTWDQNVWQHDDWTLPASIGYADLVMDYAWESHLDASLPTGYRTHLPCPWVAHKLGLKPDPVQPGVWLIGDEIVFKELKGDEGSSVCLLRFDQLKDLFEEEFTHFSFLIAERNAWPGGSNAFAAWRRTEGMSWLDSKRTTSKFWHQDTKK